MCQKWFSLSLIMVLSMLSSAMPNEPRIKCKTYVDTFDNITTTVPELSAITYYGGLHYNDVDAAPGLLLGLGIIPASASNVAVATVNQDLLKSLAITLNPFVTMSMAGTSTQYFSLTEFYYACTIATNSEPAPSGCVIQVSGFNIYGQQVGSVSFAFAPNNELTVGMSRAKLPIGEYVYMKNVTFSIATAVSTPDVTTLILDNVTHTNCY